MKEIALGITLCAALASQAWAQAAPHGHAVVYGEPGDPKAVTRTIKVDMADSMRFTPALIEIRRGETIRFLIENKGKLKHEMTLGTAHDLEEHAAEMKKNPGMEHDEPNNANVDPGKTGEIVWRFTRAGTFEFACLHVGHFDAGMRGRIAVR